MPKDKIIPFFFFLFFFTTPGQAKASTFPQMQQYMCCMWAKLFHICVETKKKKTPVPSTSVSAREVTVIWKKTHVLRDIIWLYPCKPVTKKGAIILWLSGRLKRASLFFCAVISHTNLTVIFSPLPALTCCCSCCCCAGCWREGAVKQTPFIEYTEGPSDARFFFYKEWHMSREENKRISQLFELDLRQDTFLRVSNSPFLLMV